ncbi:hypothetical protein [Mycobacteroides abscessus]|uniref:hypothetical protein n=1 Tax=Mycobacteroides abscessus TaxID=36809 RepID=UPI00266EA939|nr:hypothetical protein [Mycobacteroides abscessus]MDO3110447.1 hypothetical protein [Mycobacteroides abscessus subsp. abscessus]
MTAPTFTADPRLAIAEAAVAALPAEVQARAVIDTSALPDSDFPAAVRVGDWYARVCYANHDGHDGHDGIGFVAYLGHDLYTAPTAAYAISTVEMAATVANWINQPGLTYAETRAIEEELMALARRLRAILRGGGDAAEITAEVRTLDPAAEALLTDPNGYAHPHLVTVHDRELLLGHDAGNLGWVWQWAIEIDAA